MIKLSVPDIGNEELEEIIKVLSSKNLVQGEKVQQFEEVLSKYLNIKYCIAVSSGTAALHLALLSLGIGKEDQVIVPDFTFPATANAVELTGATPSFVDISLDSFCIDANKIEQAINGKTKVIMPVHEFGQCADMDKIMDIARKSNLKVVEDGACALGSSYKGKKAGTMGDLGCFSFHPRKIITTGEGGMIVTQEEELAKKIISLRNHGISYINGKTCFTQPGFNYRMTDIQAAMGIAQMKKLDKIIHLRKNIVKEYSNLLGSSPNLILPIEKSYGEHTYQTYHVLLNKKLNRDYIKQLLNESLVESNIGAYALHEQLYYKNKYSFNMDFTNSEIAYTKGLALPLHSDLNYDKLQYISNILLNQL